MAPRKNPSNYGQDLAFIHDDGFGGFAHQASPEILALLAERGITDGRLVDLGCGSGIFARVAVDAGYDVLGIDQSQAMIELAQDRVPEARFRRQSFTRARLPKCRAVVAMGEVFNFLFDKTVGEKSLDVVFARVNDALEPGGLFVFDVAIPNRSKSAPKERFWDFPDWALLVRTEEDPRKKLLTRTMTQFRRVRTTFRRTEEVHQLRLYSRTRIGNSLRKLGFKVRTLQGYGKQPFVVGHTGFLARKPTS